MCILSRLLDVFLSRNIVAVGYDLHILRYCMFISSAKLSRHEATEFPDFQIPLSNSGAVSDFSTRIDLIIALLKE